MYGVHAWREEKGHDTCHLPPAKSGAYAKHARKQARHKQARTPASSEPKQHLDAHMHLTVRGHPPKSVCMQSNQRNRPLKHKDHQLSGPVRYGHCGAQLHPTLSNQAPRWWRPAVQEPTTTPVCGQVSRIAGQPIKTQGKGPPSTR
jgi:hypothetical protein